MSRIINATEILNVGPYNLRRDALQIIQAAVDAADPYQAAHRLLQREGSHFNAAGSNYDLDQWKHIYVLGAGKATQGIALALEELIGDRIDGGLIVLKHGEESQLRLLPVVHASHPVPNLDSLQAGQKLYDLAANARKGDLVISAFTGGSSALAVLPVQGITLKDKQTLNRLLLECGATIFEINAVRKHISRIKAGGLALQVFPADLICLTVSDVVGDQFDYITDLTVPDTSTYQDAWNTLDKYELWERIPASVCEHLRRAAEIETPKDFTHPYQPVLLVPGDAAYQGALTCCKALGYSVRSVKKELEGDSRQEATALVRMADEWFNSAITDEKSALLASGETTVTIRSAAGKGGPNQEFAAGAALEIFEKPGIVVAAIDMDGTDGPTDAAGAVVDGFSVQRGAEAGVDAATNLEQHNTYEFLKASGDLVFTGPTGTNVNDLMFVLMEHSDQLK